MDISGVNDKIKKELAKERDSNLDYRTYLKRLLKLCRDSISELSDVSFRNDLPYGTNRNILNKEILNSTNALLRAYNSYSDGKLSSAITTIRNRFLTPDAIQTFELKHEQNWYRARKTDNSGSGLKAKEMFHIPFEKRTDVVNYRFSISGYPCLYIGNSLLTCWEEMHCPQLHGFVVSKVAIKKENVMRVLDLRIPEDSKEEVSDTNRRHRNLMLLKTWPLIIACSIKTITPNSSFKFEYIHPQLLMLAIKEQNQDLYGVAYTSSHVDSTMTTDISLYTNVAIPVRKAETKGYCKYLSSLFEITRGVSFMEADLKNVFDLTCTLKVDNLDGTITVETFRDGSAPYNITKFGQLEQFLNSVDLESI